MEGQEVGEREVGEGDKEVGERERYVERGGEGGGHLRIVPGLVGPTCEQVKGGCSVRAEGRAEWRSRGENREAGLPGVKGLR